MKTFEKIEIIISALFMFALFASFPVGMGLHWLINTGNAIIGVIIIIIGVLFGLVMSCATVEICTKQ